MGLKPVVKTPPKWYDLTNLPYCHSKNAATLKNFYIKIDKNCMMVNQNHASNKKEHTQNNK